MYKIILIVGLPGSGKTHLANTLSNESRIFDDITSIDDLPSNDNFVIVDVNFCDSNILKKAIDILSDKFKYHTIDIMYFENDPVKCRANVEYRKLHQNDTRNVEGTIKRFEKIYNPPLNSMKIWVANTIEM